MTSSTGLRMFWRVVSTFLVTSLIGVLFRSPDISTAAAMYKTMFGLGNMWVPRYIGFNLGIDNPHYLGSLVLDPVHIPILLVMSFIVWSLPNTRTFFADYWCALDQRSNKPKSTVKSVLPYLDSLRFKPSVGWGMVFAVLIFLIIGRFGQPARFIYYQF